jgi:hypothetical protein
MYLLTTTIIIITYYSYKWYNFYKLPEEWKDLPAIPFWRKIYRMLTNPAPMDTVFSKNIHPYTEKIGMAVVRYYIYV